MPAPTKRQANKAIKDAIADHRIPADTDHVGYRYGTGYTAEYGLYWQRLGLAAPFRQRTDGTFYLGHANQIDCTSHMAAVMVVWTP